MVKHTTPTELKSLSRFLQIFDGSFPSGAFVHSFGLEPHILKNKVSTIEDLKAYLLNLFLDQYLKIEFVCIKKAYEAFAKNQEHLIKKLDNSYGAYLTYEYAKASQDLGHNYLLQIYSWANKPIVQNYFKAVQNKHCSGNELVVLSAFAFDLDIAMEEFMVLWAKKNMMNIALCSLKISRIKPSEVQQLLFEFDELLSNIQLETLKNKMTNFNPLFEEIIFAHKNLEPKMFVT